VTASAKPIRAVAIVEQLLKAIEPERRLRGVTLESRVNVGDKSVVVDEELLVSALSGLLSATVGLSEEPSAFTVTVSAESRGSEIVFGIAQDQVAAPGNWGSTAHAIGAGRVAATFKGRVTATSSGGTDIRLILPRV
jgi:hypothetical protein